MTWEEAAGYSQDIQHVVQAEELAKDLLAMDVKAKSPLRVSQAEAREDVERLFYLLEYGWCGYGYFTAEFVPEKVTTNKLVSTFTRIRWMLILIVVGAFILIVFRKEPRIYVLFGICCLPTSVIMIAKDSPQGFWLISYGLMFIFIGVINYRKKKAHPQVQVQWSE